jgi:hypothetical protein
MLLYDTPKYRRWLRTRKKEHTLDEMGSLRHVLTEDMSLRVTATNCHRCVGPKRAGHFGLREEVKWTEAGQYTDGESMRLALVSFTTSSGGIL